MLMKQWIGITLNLLFFKAVTAIYFPQRNYTLTIPSDLEKGQKLLKIFALPEYNESGTMLYSVVHGSLPSLQRIAKNQADIPLFRIDQKSGIIVLNRVINTATDLTGNFTEFVLKISATLGGPRQPDRTSSASVGISVAKPSVLKRKYGEECTSPEARWRYCYGGTQTDLMLQENGSRSRFASLRSLVLESRCRDLRSTYEVKNVYYRSRGQELIPKTFWIQVENRTSDVEINGTLDRDSDGGERFSIVLTCHVFDRLSGEVHGQYDQKLETDVLDINDNGPYITVRVPGAKKPFKANTKYAKITLEDRSTWKRQFVVIDKDEIEEGSYQVTVENDSLGLVKITSVKKWRGLISAEVTVTDLESMPSDTYSFVVRFNDTGLLSAYNKTSTAEYEIELTLPPRAPNREECLKIVERQYARNLSRHAGMYTRIIELAPDTPGIRHQNLSFSIISQTVKGLFNITRHYGILFVESDTFRTSKVNVTHVTINVHDGICMADYKTNVTVRITGVIADRKDTCDTHCAFTYEPSVCRSSCGFGASDGQCKMRFNKGRSISTNYSTCSPDLSFCPDKKCDELEQEKNICPQDCTKESTGCGENKGRGIQAATLVWCPKPGVCNCDVNPEISTNHTAEARTPPNPGDGKAATTTPKSKDAQTRLAQLQGDNAVPVYANVCDHVCRVIIGVSVGLAAILAVVGCFVYRFYIRKGRKSDDMKHVNSVVSLNAIPSDYVDGADRRHSMAVSNHSNEWSPRFVAQSMTIDSKWEFPRNSITLEKVLGEGEFGRVLQAKVPTVNGYEKETTVAIKMLKDCASVAELRDLLSEFNLLKDVSHPNVIKLLGACTKSGPFYLIVEHCEHGSLKNYLRQKRHVEALYLGPIQTCEPSSDDEYETPIDSSFGDPESDDVISAKDLISFAWQVSKGMEYLSAMKLVHRDLAARNVLVAKGKKVKISDFGLTRDIYEADAYTKKTKGRIPVKWMAPESLYDQVYTTKSDVWSFGIVLWEITTLGATPYPGIPPERLYNILKTGYRMERPDNCSLDLYSIMSKCWSTSPIDRPSFQELVTKFEEMLSANIVYLDLTSVIEHIPIVDDKDAEESTAAQRTAPETRVPPATDDDPEYGSINILSVDANAYLAPNTHLRDEYESEVNLEDSGPQEGTGERTRLLVLDMPREQRQPNDAESGDEEEEVEKDLLKAVPI